MNVNNNIINHNNVEVNDMDAEYVYFFSYSHEKGFGNCEMRLKNKIENLNDINSVQNEISYELDIDGVIILNYQLLRVI